MAVKYSLSVKTGTYKDQSGVEKGRYQNVGEVHTGQNGSFFARINPYTMLGLCHRAIQAGDDSLLVGLFDPQPNNAQSAPAPAARSQPPAAPMPAAYDADIPF